MGCGVLLIVHRSCMVCFGQGRAGGELAAAAHDAPPAKLQDQHKQGRQSSALSSRHHSSLPAASDAYISRAPFTLKSLNSSHASAPPQGGAKAAPPRHRQALFQALAPRGARGWAGARHQRSARPAAAPWGGRDLVPAPQPPWSGRGRRARVGGGGVCVQPQLAAVRAWPPGQPSQVTRRLYVSKPAGEQRAVKRRGQGKGRSPPPKARADERQRGPGGVARAGSDAVATAATAAAAAARRTCSRSSAVYE
jgi:hypothetical protein